MCVVEVANQQDVSIVMKLVAATRTPFAVKSGGHASNPGFSSTKGVHISLVRFNQVKLSSDKSTAKVGTGLVRFTPRKDRLESTDECSDGPMFIMPLMALGSRLLEAVSLVQVWEAFHWEEVTPVGFIISCSNCPRLSEDVSYPLLETFLMGQLLTIPFSRAH